MPYKFKYGNTEIQVAKVNEVVSKSADANAHFSVKQGYLGLDTATGNYLRTPLYGIIPASDSISEPSQSRIGTDMWRFYYGYFENISISNTVSTDTVWPSWLRTVNNNEINISSSNIHCLYGYRTQNGYTPINYYQFCTGIGENGLGRATLYAGAYSQGSDRKLKKEFSVIEKAKNFILSLSPIEYTMIDGKRRHMGFIAQEVSKLCKDLKMGDMALYKANVISDEKDEGGKPKLLYFDDDIDDKKLSWSLDYSEFIAPLVTTVQEQQKEINSLKNDVKELKELLLQK